jgi:hypothetical protein
MFSMAEQRFSTAERRFSMAQRRLWPWFAHWRMGQAYKPERLLCLVSSLVSLRPLAAFLGVGRFLVLRCGREAV